MGCISMEGGTQICTPQVFVASSKMTRWHVELTFAKLVATSASLDFYLRPWSEVLKCTWGIFISMIVRLQFKPPGFMGLKFKILNLPWSVQANMWQQLSPGGTSPPALDIHEAVWSPAADGMYLFGGRETNSQILSEISTCWADLEYVTGKMRLRFLLDIEHGWTCQRAGNAFGNDVEVTRTLGQARASFPISCISTTERRGTKPFEDALPKGCKVCGFSFLLHLWMPLVILRAHSIVSSIS